jgi:hypothetical protein
MKGVIGHSPKSLLTSELILCIEREWACRGVLTKMDFLRTRLAVYAATRCKDEPANSKPLADVSQGEHTSIVATVCETDIEVARWITDKPCYPYHSIATSQMRQHFVSVRNIDLQATEIRMIAKWTQGVVTKPEGINRYNLNSLAYQMST